MPGFHTIAATGNATGWIAESKLSTGLYEGPPLSRKSYENQFLRVSA